MSSLRFRHSCVGCRREVRRVSNQNLCGACSYRKLLHAAKEMKAKNGPAYDAWLVKMKRVFSADGDRGPYPLV